MSWSAASLRLHVQSVLTGRVVSPFRFREARVLNVVSTGISALDELTGGLPRGCLTEIYGAPGSGKTSLLQSALAARTQSVEACALVDAQNSFDPAGSQSAGVVLPRLLWVRCAGIDQALRSVDLLLHGGGFGLVALDLGSVPARLVRQVQLNVWFRMRRAVEDTSTVFLVLAQESNAKTCASLVLHLERESSSWSLPAQKATAHSHTPGCLLDGGTYSAEMMRSFSRHKKPACAGRPLFVDRPKTHQSSETAHFQLHSDQLVEAEDLRTAEALLPVNESKDESEDRFEERMYHPG